MTPSHILRIPFLTTRRTSSIWLDVDRSLSPMLSMAVMIVATLLLVLAVRVPHQVVLPIAADAFRRAWTGTSSCASESKARWPRFA